MKNDTKLYIGNAFSLSMLDREQQAGEYARKPIPCADPKKLVDQCISFGTPIISVMGHSYTIPIFEKELGGIKLALNRINLKLTSINERLLVGQYIGERLPEGATELPEGSIIEWWTI